MFLSVLNVPLFWYGCSNVFTFWSSKNTIYPHHLSHPPVTSDEGLENGDSEEEEEEVEEDADMDVEEDDESDEGISVHFIASGMCFMLVSVSSTCCSLTPFH